MAKLGVQKSKWTFKFFLNPEYFHLYISFWRYRCVTGLSAKKYRPMKKLIFLLIPLFMISCDPADLQRAMDTINSAGALSNLDVSNGLKEALNKGVGNSVNYLSATDGYYKSAYKILLPEEANTVISKLKFIPGFTNLEEELIKKINRGAEDAAKRAGPIFVNAIKKMTFDDAMNILMGEKNAATNYLHNNTYSNLYGEFKPEIVTSLNTVKAQDLWASAVNKYNSLPLVDDVNPDLADHVSTKALVGLFGLIEKKELGIRNNVNERSTDLLRRVFAKQD